MQLFSHKFGHGPPLVVLHGLFGMSDNWLTIGKKLAQKGFNVHLPDIRNHGQSPHKPSHTYNDICDDLVGYLQKENFSEVGMIGHSMGGRAAMAFGLLYPKRVKKLAVIDIAPSDYGRESISYHTGILQNLMEIDLATYSSRHAIMAEMESRLHDTRLVMFLAKSITKNADGIFYWRLNLPVLLQALPVISASFDSFGDYAPCPVNTLFVKGENSEYILPRHEPERMRFYPRSSIVTIDNGGHWLHMEQPEKLLEVLLGFFAGG